MLRHYNVLKIKNSYVHNSAFLHLKKERFCKQNELYKLTNINKTKILYSTILLLDENIN